MKLRYERPVIKKLSGGMPGKYGANTNHEPVTHIDGVAVKEVLEEHGSPCFVLSEKTIRNTYKSALNEFKIRYPKVQFAWSYKTNYMNAVCKVFHQEGSWGEVVSGFEYQKALRNGVPGDKIIFNGPDKTKEDHKMAIENNSPIHIDHLDELYQIIEMTREMDKTARVAIRVNMDTGVYPMWDRFGFNYENGQAKNALDKIMKHEKLELIGLHSHIGTFMLSSNAYGIAAVKLADLAIYLRNEYNHLIKYIDCGGGFASKNTLKGAYLSGNDITPTFADYAEQISTALLSSDLKQNELPTLILETGRALIDDAGYLLGSVLANKRLSDGRRATIMDFGVNLMFTSFWYEHKISPAQECSSYAEDTVMYGPLCMNIDVLRESISIPPLNKGDQVVVHRVGAYNMTQWMQFIAMRPRIVMIDIESNTHVIRESENLDYMMQLEQVPEHLNDFKL